MITPAFDLSQDQHFLFLSIRVPFTRTSEFDLYIHGTDFKFYAKPYFLRLSLPGRIVEDGREKAQFDIDKGVFTLQVSKETPGEDFEGLQMLTRLLAPKGSRSAKPLVEDLNCEGGGEEEEEEDFDWQLEQEAYQETSEEELRTQHKYGFGNQRSGVFSRLQEELSDVIDLKNPEAASAAERRTLRLEAEDSAFSADHYLSDLFEDGEIQRLLKFRPWWSNVSGDAAVSFSEDEKEQLRKFTNRSFLMDKTSRQQVWLGLLDILLCYCYEARSTEGEHNVESAWTIRKLSGTLCWLETFRSVQDVLVAFGRRVMCFPLHRHFGLVSAALRDAAEILQAGRAAVLRCLLDVHRVFRENEPAYILNQLYVSDYCVWIQRIRSKQLTAFVASLQEAALQKEDLELELPELEQAAALVLEEEEEEEEEEEDEEEEEEDEEEEEEEDEEETSSSSSSSEEEEEEEGGEAAEGGASKDRPPQPPLIQELGQRLAEELQISEENSSSSSSNSSNNSNSSSSNNSSSNSSSNNSSNNSSSSSNRTLLEPSSSHRNLLQIVPTAATDPELEHLL